MNRFAKLAGCILSWMILVIGCNDKRNSSPFDKILTQAPYAGLTDSIKKKPGNDTLYFRRAILLNKNNLPEPALADFQKAWSLKKEERYAFGIGVLLLEKKPDSAIIFLNEALKELPESVLLQINLARAYDAQNKPDDALRICDELLQINPGQAVVLKMKAGLLERKGNDQEAINTLEKAYSLTPFDVELNYDLAFKYAENKNPKVIRLCDSLAKKDSLGLHAEPWYYKGIYYSNIKDYPEAIAQFNKAIQHDYNFKNAYIEKGRVYYEQKKMAEAFKVFNLAVTISPGFADAWFWMGKCQEAMGQKDEARLNYERAYGLDKTFTEAKEAADRMKN